VTSTETTVVSVIDLDKREIVNATAVTPGGDSVCCARNNTIAPDGRTVGVGNTFGDAVVVDAVDGTVGGLVHAHPEFVESVAVSPDHDTFVTTGRDGAVKLWDKSDQLIVTLLPFGNARVRASFLAPDRVMLVSDRGDVLEWDPRPESWEAYACSVAGRNLSQAEWAQFLPGRDYHATCAQFSPGV
jgi:WD40 repeat protein